MKILKALVITALFAATAMAQDMAMTGATWNIGLASGRMANFLTEPSFGGFGIEGRRFLDDDFSIGGSFSWNYWSEMNGDIIQLKQGAVSGTQIRYVNSIPLMLNAHYYIGGKRDQLRPYLGINVGTYYITQRLDMGIYSLQNDNWHFGIAPEFGFLAEVSRGTYLTASGRYNYAFDSGDTMAGDSKNIYSYWGINIGLMWSNAWF
jgi:hypothetical protein